MKPIPEAALQQHIAVLGKTGSGKTFAAKAVIVEPLLAARRRVAIVDPTDAWWGLRSSRDGKGAGFPVLVLGGDHGDLPLPAAGGAAVARLLVEQGVNLVASTKHLTVGERTRWFIDFAGTVSRLNRAPLHLVIDEAHNFAPQGKVPDPDTGRMLHAANTLASAGRSIGVRLVMITQRPQKLHKDALTSADTLIAMRVLAPHDRDAVKAWIDGCGEPLQGKEVLNSLAGLKRGEGWVWYPEGGHLARVRFPEIQTFDSSATPTDGHAVKAPKAAAELDLTEINKALAEAVAEAEANDPKRLRAKVAESRALVQNQAAEIKRLNARLSGSAGGGTKAQLAEEYSRGRAEGFEAGRQGMLGGMAPLFDRLATLSSALTETIEDFRKDVQRLSAASHKSMRSAHVSGPVDTSPLPARGQVPPKAPPPRPTSAQRAAYERHVAEAITAPRQRILNALAFFEGIGISPVDREQLALMAGAPPTSGGYKNNLGALNSSGFISYPTAGAVALTDMGRGVSSTDGVPTSPAELHDTLRARLAPARWRIVETLIGVYPASLQRVDLAERVGVPESSGGFKNNLGALRTLGVIDYPVPGEVVALPVLFLDR